MNNKAKELEMRNIMQGLEEFATFMSFQGDNGSLRILSVETIAQAEQAKTKPPTAQIFNMPKPTKESANDQSIHRSLSFQDRKMH